MPASLRSTSRILGVFLCSLFYKQVLFTGPMMLQSTFKMVNSGCVENNRSRSDFPDREGGAMQCGVYVKLG